MKILITYAGGHAGQSIIKSLQSLENVSIFGIDIDPNTPSFKWIDHGIVCPKSKTPEYESLIKKILEENKIDLVLPTGEEDQSFLSSLKSIYPNTVFYMSDTEVIDTCQNKWSFYLKCKNKFDLPKTSLVIPDLPYFEKPIYGRGSIGTRLVECEQDRNTCDPKLIYQEVLPGEEWTVDVLSDLDCKVLNVTPRKRLLIKSGISVQGKIELNPELISISTRLVKFLNIKGPSCVQFKKDHNGKFKIIEVNTRFGGGIIFTMLAGINQPKMIIKDIRKEENLQTKAKEVIVARYYMETVI
jgi:carbamoyl-phosphate synthase large subunit